MTRSRKPWLALAAVGAVALSGCGSSNSSSTTNVANSSVEAQTSSAAGSSGLSDAQAALAQAYAGSDRALPASSPKPPKGKTVWILSCSQAAPGCAVPAAVAAAKASGRKVILTGGEGLAPNIALIKKGVQDFAAGVPTGWVGWASIDGVSRMLDGQPQVDEGLGNGAVDRTHNLPTKTPYYDGNPN